MMDSSKTKQKGVDPNSIDPSFFAFRNISNNVCIQRKAESLDLGEVEDQIKF